MPQIVAVPEARRVNGTVLWYNATTGNGQLRPNGAGDPDIFFRREEVTFVDQPGEDVGATALEHDGARAPPSTATGRSAPQLRHSCATAAAATSCSL